VVYKSVPVDSELYAVLCRLKESLHFSSFNALIEFLVSKTRKKSAFGTAPWLKGFERDEQDRVL